MSWNCEVHPQISSSGETLVITDGDYFTQCCPLNAYFKPESGGISSGCHFWELEFKQTTGAWVGITTDQSFGPGYSFNGLMYGGNLSDGNGLLVSNFGDTIQDRDKIGALLELTDDNLRLYFFHNGHALGLAFDIKKPYPTPLFPAVQCYGPGRVTIRSGSAPTMKDREEEVFSHFAGNWKGDMIKVDTDGKEVVLPSMVKLSVVPVGFRRFECCGSKVEQARLFSFTFRIVNTISAQLELKGGKWNLQPGAITCIGITGDDWEGEEFLSLFLKEFETISMLNDAELVLTSKQGSKIHFSRYTKSKPKPVEQHPFGTK